jgi:hypothetical protein
LLLPNAAFFQLIKTLMPLMAPSKPLMANKILGVLKIWLAQKLGQVGRRFFLSGQWFLPLTVNGEKT